MDNNQVQNNSEASPSKMNESTDVHLNGNYSSTDKKKRSFIKRKSNTNDSSGYSQTNAGYSQSSVKLNFKQTNQLKESHANSIFGVAFNTRNRNSESCPLLFATVGGVNVSVYQCHPGGEITLIQGFADPSPEEDFYCCAWSYDIVSCQQLLAAAGKRGVIRILCPSLAVCKQNLIGHGESVNELKFHPKNPSLLFSFSKDYNIRLWNITTEALVCVFGGAEGHRSEILHGDINLSGTTMLSCGMDHAVKIWRLDNDELKVTIEKSFKYDPIRSKKPFDTLLQHFPDFSTRDAHGNYVDCCRWFGNLIVSKSCENSLVIWKPGDLDSNLDLKLGDTKISILHQLEARDCQIWFIRFDIDFENKILALGSSTGKLYLYDLNSEDIFSLQPNVLNVTRGNGAVRQTHFGNNGKTLLCVCDFGTIVRFDRE